MAATLWSRLPAEFWAKVFAAAQQSVYMQRCMDPQSYVSEEIAPKQAWFHGPLKLVCKKFSLVFAEHPDMYSIYVHAAPQIKHVASWINWMQQHGHAVQDITVSGDCSGMPEAVLPFLHIQQAPLWAARISDTQDQGLYLLALFTTLTDCRLHAPAQEQLNVQPLRALPRLTRLELWNGSFVGVEVLEHLTSLTVSDAQVECFEDSHSVTCLLELELHDSQLGRFHSRGLGACTGLLDLTFGASSMLAETPDESMQCGNHFQFATNLTALTNLTFLHFGTWHRPVQLEWLTGLTSLLKLSVVVEPSKAHPVVFPTALSLLSSVTALSIHGMNRFGEMHLNFEWAKFPSLACVFLGGQFRFNRGLDGLRDLKHLIHLDFGRFLVSNPDSTQQVAEVISQLSQNRPSIRVTTNTGL